jgi:hypothetical protein
MWLMTSHQMGTTIREANVIVGAPISWRAWEATGKGEGKQMPPGMARPPSPTFTAHS